jgi:hypothetical protein
MKIHFTDDVSGVIVGTDYIQGILTYENRKQGSDMYASSENELKSMSVDKLWEMKVDCGDAFYLIYPDKMAWTVKIIG